MAPSADRRHPGYMFSTGRDRELILIIGVTERPTLRSVEYEGLKKLKRADISDKIAAGTDSGA